MKPIDTKYFQKFAFTKDQIGKYWKNALKDLGIAKQDAIPEVKFNYSYNALIKAGIALLAKKEGVKIRSVPGHHVKLLEKFSELAGDPQILVVGNVMRAKRNADLYSGGVEVTDKEALEFFEFVDAVMVRIKNLIISTR